MLCLVNSVAMRRLNLDFSVKVGLCACMLALFTPHAAHHTMRNMHPQHLPYGGVCGSGEFNESKLFHPCKVSFCARNGDFCEEAGELCCVHVHMQLTPGTVCHAAHKIRTHFSSACLV